MAPAPCDTALLEAGSCIFHQEEKVKEGTNCRKGRGWQGRDARGYFSAEETEAAGFGRPGSRGPGLLPGCSYERLPRLLCHCTLQAPSPPLPSRCQHFLFLTRNHASASLQAQGHQQRGGCPAPRSLCCLRCPVPREGGDGHKARAEPLPAEIPGTTWESSTTDTSSSSRNKQLHCE